jgi:hypothetical protein
MDSHENDHYVTGTRGKVTAAPSEVVVLTPTNFDKVVLDTSKSCPSRILCTMV